jgi:hypothetical protein
MDTTARIVLLGLLAGLAAGCSTAPPEAWVQAKRECGREMVARTTAAYRETGNPMFAQPGVGGAYIEMCMKDRGLDPNAYRS